VKTRLLLLALGLTLAIASPIQADEMPDTESINVPKAIADGLFRQTFSEDWVREAPYIGISGVFGVEEMGGDLAAVTNPSNGGGLNVRAGYRMFRYASIEIEGEWIRDFGSGLDNPYIITGNMRFYYPFGPNDRFQPYIVAGAGVMVPNVNGKNETTGGFRAGIGMDFYISEHWSIGPAAEWVSTTSENPALQYLSVQFGVQYMFGAGSNEDGL